jgi:hypothetical protein
MTLDTVMLSVILNVVMLSVANKPIMLSVIMLNVVIMCRGAYESGAP